MFLTTHNPMGSIPYWALVVILIAFGCFGILSIGAPFLLLGITLAILWPWRHRTGVIPAGVAAIFGFTFGYLLVVPLHCTTSQSSYQPIAHTVCAYLIVSVSHARTSTTIRVSSPPSSPGSPSR